jgi:RNA polymerase sigma-70 factor (ECF subfamily)
MIEKEIVEKCKSGDRKAFTFLYNKYAPKMLGVCFRYAKSRDEAEDMLQEGFVRLFQNIKSFKGSGSFEGWMRRIIVNTAINYYKTQIKYNNTVNVENNEYLFKQEEPETDSKYGDVSQSRLLEMIKELPDGYKMVFNLYVLDGYSHQEIADILSVSINTSKSQLSKARRMLRDKVEKYRKQYKYA